jgi:hypothetical protein
MKASLSHWASRLLHCEEKPSSKGAHNCSLPVNARALVFFLSLAMCLMMYLGKIQCPGEIFMPGASV